MVKEKKLSIIIPYYNTYEMTRQLIKSLIAQTTEEVEVILIDDGCYEVRFDVFSGINGIDVIHQENGGVSKARNTGLHYASGKYVAFVDSDDMVMSDYIKRLLELIDTHDEDIIVFNWLDINTNEVNRHPTNCAVWKAIYKKDILPKFDETLKVREDYFYQKELANKNPSIYYYDRVLYIYNSGREGSLWWNETHK